MAPREPSKPTTTAESLLNVKFNGSKNRSSFHCSNEFYSSAFNGHRTRFVLSCIFIFSFRNEWCHEHEWHSHQLTLCKVSMQCKLYSQCCAHSGMHADRQILWRRMVYEYFTVTYAMRSIGSAFVSASDAEKTHSIQMQIIQVYL